MPTTQTHKDITTTTEIKHNSHSTYNRQKTYCENRHNKGHHNRQNNRTMVNEIDFSECSSDYSDISDFVRGFKIDVTLVQ